MAVSKGFNYGIHPDNLIPEFLDQSQSGGGGSDGVSSINDLSGAVRAYTGVSNIMHKPLFQLSDSQPEYGWAADDQTLNFNVFLSALATQSQDILKAGTLIDIVIDASEGFKFVTNNGQADAIISLLHRVTGQNAESIYEVQPLNGGTIGQLSPAIFAANVADVKAGHDIMEIDDDTIDGLQYHGVYRVECANVPGRPATVSLVPVFTFVTGSDVDTGAAKYVGTLERFVEIYGYTFKNMIVPDGASHSLAGRFDEPVIVKNAGESAKLIASGYTLPEVYMAGTTAADLVIHTLQVGSGYDPDFVASSEPTSDLSINNVIRVDVVDSTYPFLNVVQG